MARTGNEYIQSLRDGRQIFIDGRLVDNHVDHPAFRNAIRSAAKLYDYQAANQGEMTFTTPTGKRVNRSWELPDTREKLVKRGLAAQAWAAQSYGWLGRSPDHVPAAITGMVTHIDVFEGYDKKRASALRGYYEYARDRDLAMTYTIVNPQGDRSKLAGEHDDKYHSLGAVDEDAEGITVRGAKMLGTSAPLAEEVLVGVQNPLKEGIDDIYALSFALPLATKGVKILSRKSYEEAAHSQFDNPLAARFDENDAVVYFDDVKVPWERVFVYKKTSMCRAQFHATGAEILMNTQSQARYSVKLKFLAGLARRIAETTGVINFPAIQESLGNLASQAMVIDGMFRSLLHDPIERNGYFIPRQLQIYTTQAYSQELYPAFITAIRKLAGGSVIMLPSGVEDFDNPEMAALINKTQYSSTASPEERVKVMKLAWDALGSEFGSRHTQYEMFYNGPHFAALMRVFGAFDWGFAKGMVDELLGSYSRQSERREAAE
ncbi:4-hydroxyphenylacetate 3-monooxygenase [Mesorhizobium sp. M4A.F.Ca.ET.020.02.1.1]|uniref:4-hydroxyphenylacetate 3-hydroxylase family protein n=1 Tax=unclassified Mesorhizobium TaxID=325217 RepID=UPI000FD4E5A8|nr:MULTISPECIES: 4-hydroxyphenylacetate 3-hydroxylase N-terminal domain-containing protein [unclassified Mesorhizobium]RVD33764.1 4-hydroxyphenylacetate 3-monooxygenase [Mesorhizobium sp. M4A.F.Ca.ET.020.02.1.1]RWC17082.1 MAG: 4-hydroxyphenylacetate 3-monooxygenase [Mesorhizobium sp.]